MEKMVSIKKKKQCQLIFLCDFQNLTAQLIFLFSLPCASIALGLPQKSSSWKCLSLLARVTHFFLQGMTTRWTGGVMHEPGT